jgi:hypothetical protein
MFLVHRSKWLGRERRHRGLGKLIRELRTRAWPKDFAALNNIGANATAERMREGSDSGPNS